MYNVRKVTDDLYWVGVNDHRTTLFENVHPIPKGVSYNSYLLLDSVCLGYVVLVSIYEENLGPH